MFLLLVSNSYVSGLAGAIGLLSGSVLFIVVLLGVYWYSNKHSLGQAGTVIESAVEPGDKDEGDDTVAKKFAYAM